VKFVVIGFKGGKLQVMGEKKKVVTLGLKRLDKPGRICILPMLNTPLLRRAEAHKHATQ
jgi:hypothetical protein